MSKKEPDSAGPLPFDFGLRLAAAGWRLFAAISVEDTTGYGIKRTSSGLKSAGDFLQFLFTQKAGAGPAQYSVFLQVWHRKLPSM
jgi:hypothetical protein